MYRGVNNDVMNDRRGYVLTEVIYSSIATRQQKHENKLLKIRM